MRMMIGFSDFQFFRDRKIQLQNKQQGRGKAEKKLLEATVKIWKRAAVFDLVKQIQSDSKDTIYRRLQLPKGLNNRLLPS